MTNETIQETRGRDVDQRRSPMLSVVRTGAGAERPSSRDGRSERWKCLSCISSMALTQSNSPLLSCSKQLQVGTELSFNKATLLGGCH